MVHAMIPRIPKVCMFQSCQLARLQETERRDSLLAKQHAKYLSKSDSCASHPLGTTWDFTLASQFHIQYICLARLGREKRGTNATNAAAVSSRHIEIGVKTCQK